MKIFWKFLKIFVEFYINFSKNFQKTLLRNFLLNIPPNQIRGYAAGTPSFLLHATPTSAALRPMLHRRIAADAPSTHCGRRAADVRPTHCGRRSICRSIYELLCVGRVRRMHQSSLQESYCSEISRDFQCFATVTHASMHRSDRCDHSPNRPHAADARPTCGRRNAADY